METEAKILEVNRNELEGKLLDMGAEKIFDDEIYAVYYDNGTLNSQGKSLRLRKEGKKGMLAYKGKNLSEEAKIMDEKETEVNFDDMHEILIKLGFKPFATLRKHRISYKLDGVRFEFDKYLDEFSFVPELMEIEAKDIATIYKHAKILGYEESDCRPWTAADVIRYYQK